MKKMLFVLLLIVPLCGAEGATYSVDCNDPAADFSGINAAVDFASDGDTIVVKPCTYNENINFQGKALEIRSLYPENSNIVSSTIISVSSGYAVTFASGEGGGSVLTGLTITGGGILCSSSSPVISKNIITDCNNNGITCQDGSAPLIIDNLITSNSPSGISGSRGYILDNEITYNGPESGISFFKEGEASGNLIANNFSSDHGGGIYQAWGDVLGNIIINNEAGFNGGGIYGSVGTIVENMIIGNKAGNQGGGIYDSRNIIQRNIIAGNRAVSGSGIGNINGGIYNNTITGNRVEEYGTLYNCRGWIENNIIAYNEGPSGVSGIYGTGGENSYNCFWKNSSGSNFSGGALRGEGDIIVDPCLAALGYWDANGTPAEPNDDFWVDGDYHVLSEYGRWNPGIQRWVYDGQTSPCIDSGLGYWDWKGEYWPHGAHINQGRYGGTAEASMSPNDVGNVADLNLDELVDFADLTLLCEAWADDLPLLREDLDRTGFVDLPDYAILVANWTPFPLPSPNPMTWAVRPNEFPQGVVTMEASEAQSSDGSGIEYRFERSGGIGGISYSGWSTQATYTEAGLSAGVQYCYRVQARNIDNQAETDFSEAACIVVSSPPTPSPTTWAKPPNADAFDSVSMMAAPATSTDGSGVEYYFDCVSEAEGGHDRDWSDEPDYTDKVSENREYCYRVKARNKGNLLETELSEERCATTPLAPPPTPNPMIWASEPLAVTYTSITMTASEATSADGIPPEYFFWNVTRDPIPDVNNDSLWRTDPTFVDTGLTKLTTYTYRVAARNAFNKLATEWSEPRSATTPCDDSTPPYFPFGIYWDVQPCECNHDTQSNFYWYAEMRAAEAEDDSGDPLQYRFLCYDKDDLEPEFTSNWQENRCWKVWLRGRQLQGFSFAVAVRDSCGNQVESPPVLLLRCNPDGSCHPDVCDY